MNEREYMHVLAERMGAAPFVALSAAISAG